MKVLGKLFKEFTELVAEEHKKRTTPVLVVPGQPTLEETGKAIQDLARTLWERVIGKGEESLRDVGMVITGCNLWSKHASTMVTAWQLNQKEEKKDESE